MNLTAKDIAFFANGRLNKSTDDKILNITTDTREIKKGSLFIALKGENFDGHSFLEEAFKKGAAAAVSEIESELCDKYPIILVNSTYKALLDIAKGYRQSLDLKAIAVTGSVGKTTTKDMIYEVLKTEYQTYKTQGNLNNHIGVPKTIFSLEESTKMAVIEMGMNHFNEISPLTKTALPDMAVITGIGVSHIENLGSRENILKAKLEVLEGMDKTAPVIINSDNDLLGEIKALDEHKIVRCAVYDKTADVKAENLKETDGGSEFEVFYKGQKLFDATLNVMGEHNVIDALLAVAVGINVGIDAENIKKGLYNFTPSGMRQKITVKNNITFIEDCYNASPDSMRASLSVLSKHSGRKIAVLGDMFELGEHADAAHLEVAEFAKNKCDVLFTCGEKAKLMHSVFKEAQKECCHFEDKEKLSKAILKTLKEGDSVLFKASHGMHFEKIIENIYSALEGEK